MVTGAKTSRAFKSPHHSALPTRKSPTQTHPDRKNSAAHWNWARYYHAELGRFLSRDPIGYVDGMNLYRGYFVPNDTDATGRSVVVAVVAAGATAIFGIGCVCAASQFMYVFKNHKFVNDKWAHCLATCRTTKLCGGVYAMIGGACKELIRDLLFNAGTPDWADIVGNWTGVTSAGWESAFFGPFGSIPGILCGRESCFEICSRKHNRWVKQKPTIRPTRNPWVGGVLDPSVNPGLPWGTGKPRF